MPAVPASCSKRNFGAISITDVSSRPVIILTEDESERIFGLISRCRRLMCEMVNISCNPMQTQRKIMNSRQFSG